MIRVVAALIESNCKLLVCQRRAGDTFALLWEFPGGKIQRGESPEEALARELREELGVEAHIGHEIYRTRHIYSELGEPLELIFFEAEIDSAEVRNLVFERIEWRLPNSLLDVEFLPADRELIIRLASGEINLH